MECWNEIGKQRCSSSSWWEKSPPSEDNSGGSTRPHRHSNEKDSREINVNADAADEVQVFPDLTDDANRHFGRHGRHNRSCK